MNTQDYQLTQLKKAIEEFLPDIEGTKKIVHIDKIWDLHAGIEVVVGISFRIESGVISVINKEIQDKIHRFTSHNQIKLELE